MKTKSVTNFFSWKKNWWDQYLMSIFLPSFDGDNLDAENNELSQFGHHINFGYG